MDWIYFETNSLSSFAPIKINAERCVRRFGMVGNLWLLPGVCWVLPAQGGLGGTHLFWSLWMLRLC